MAPRGRTWNHVCNKCNKSFPSGRALGGHMSCHWRIIKHLKRTPSPPAIAVDVHVSLLSPRDEETLLLSSGTQCPVFSSCNSLRGHVREHSEKKVFRKPVEGSVGPMEAMATADGDYSVMLSPIVKGKRSKRETPELIFDVMDAAVTLQLLSEHAKKISAYEDCYAEDMDSCTVIPSTINAKGELLLFPSKEDMDSLSPNVSKDVKLYAFDHPLVRPAVFKKPKGHKNSAYEDCHGQWKKDSNLISNVPKDGTLIPNVPNHAAYEDFYGQCEKDKSFISTVPKDSNLIPNVPYKDINLITNVPDKDNNLIPNVHEEMNTSITNVSKKEVELNVLDCGLAGDNELRKLRTYNSVQMKCGDPSATVKVKRHQCNACGKSFGSGQALGGHMTLRHPRCNHQKHGLADCPDSIVMEEQKKKLEWVSKLLDLGVPALTDGYYHIVASLSEPQPGRVSSVY